MRKIEIIALAENVKSVVDALDAKNIKYLEIKDFEALLAVQKDLEDFPQQKCCKKEEDKPLGLIATGKNLLKSTTEHISKGMSNVSNGEHLRRLSICKSCKWVKEGFKCGKCHCFMGI